MTACAKNNGSDDDFIFSLFDHHDRIPERFWKKIKCLDQRLTGCERRGRS